MPEKISGMALALSGIGVTAVTFISQDTGYFAMTAPETEAPDALLHRFAAQALHRAESAKDTAERIGWLTRYSELRTQAAELMNAGDD